MFAVGSFLICSGTVVVAGIFAWFACEPLLWTVPFGRTPDYYRVPYYLIGFGAVTIAVGAYVRQFRRKAAGFEVKLTPSMTPGLIEKKEDDHG